MGTDRMGVKAIFDEAVEIEAPDQRQAYLDHACAGEPELRIKIDALLRAYANAGSFLQRPAVVEAVAEGATEGLRDPKGEPETRSRPPVGQGLGRRIGPYQLLQVIGEGGMGTVYLADQKKPIRRRVALKIIKPGMDSRQVIARFETERQALAMMDHPNIARVLDAGTTETGLPYFVMELVHGVPITEYCDDTHSRPRERLELFVPICQAIQHAHQKGIIHRDIKPSNVLVTQVDGKPVPKVIDFGVAKATGQELTERTMFTQFGAVVGTPEYMSPEQAALSGLDVDTRSDIYSLGVLLYELLTGTTPLDRETLRQAAFAEILRRIREEEPPKPSTRLSSSGDRLASVAATRGTEPARLARSVRGDLDWIVMKALEKDRTRRYETASGVARDIERFLEGDPVEAGPPSAAYKLRRYARKHRAAIVWSASFLGVVFGFSIYTAYLAVRATQAEHVARSQARGALRAQVQAFRQRDRAVSAEVARSHALEETRTAQAETQTALERSEQARKQSEAVSQFLIDTLRSPDPAVGGRDIKVVDLLQRAAKQLDAGFDGSPATRGALLNALGQTYLSLALPEGALSLLTTAVAVREATLGPDHPDTLESRNNLALAYDSSGRAAEAVALHERTLARFEAVLGTDHPVTLESRSNLASAYASAGRAADSAALYERVLARKEAVLGADHPHTLYIRSNLADSYRVNGRIAEAVALLERTLPTLEARLGADHPHALSCRYNLANAYVAAGRPAEAAVLWERGVSLAEPRLGADHPETLRARLALAAAYLASGRADDGGALLETTLPLIQRRLGPDHPNVLSGQGNLALAYRAAGRTADAIALQEQTLARLEKLSGADASPTVVARDNLALSYDFAGQFARSEPLHRDALRRTLRDLGPEDPNTRSASDRLALSLLHQAKCTEAEPLLRDGLKDREAKSPDDWARFNTMTLLGQALIGQARYSEAEPLVVAGYQGLKARESAIPPGYSNQLTEAAKRVVRLYTLWGKPEQASSWEARLGLAELPANVFTRP